MAVKNLSPLRILPNRVPAPDRASVEIYRPFFIAGVLSVLTAGCTLGAIAMLGIARQASYTASAWTPYVLAHANSQLYGWVGFFVMGFALQHHAPRASMLKLFHRLAHFSLALMAVGIGLRFAAEPLASVDVAVWRPIGVFSCLLQTLAVLLFVTNTTVTRYRKREPLGWQTALVFASLAWWVAVAVAEPVCFWFSHQPDAQRSVLFVAEYFPPLRDAQFLGFVSMMIFGVALVKMHSCFGAKQAWEDPGILGFVLWNTGLVVRQYGWIHYFSQGMDSQASGPYFAGGLMLAAGGVLLVASSRMFERLTEKLPSHKFIRSSLAWLLVGGAMLVLEPSHLSAVGAPFSHAYIGAVRHALTVGFISQMILGVGMRVAARMNDLPQTLEKNLWAAFWLLNVGNALRVSLEVASDYTQHAFALMGPTGFIELTGIFLWGAYMLKTMNFPRRAALAR